MIYICDICTYDIYIYVIYVHTMYVYLYLARCQGQGCRLVCFCAMSLSVCFCVMSLSVCVCMCVYEALYICVHIYRESPATSRSPAIIIPV